MSSSFLLSLLVVLLALTCPIAARPTLATILRPVAPSAPVEVAAAWALPSIFSITGCYFEERNQLQCPVGAVLQMYVTGLSDTATVTVGSDYNCAVTALNASASSLTCTLPSSIQPSDYNKNFTVTVTSGGQTSAPTRGVTFLEQATPFTITSISGCVGGFGTTATACRQGQSILITGTGIYSASYQVMIGSYPVRATFYTQNSLLCYVPTIANADLNTALPVTISVNGYTATYTPGLISYGELAITSVTGCGVTSGPVTGCGTGDVLTITGTGFNLGQPGDANNLRFYASGVSSAPAFTVLSNTVIHLTLPGPTSSDFSFSFYLYAGNPQVPARTPMFSISYSTVLLVTRTFGGVSGCLYSQQVKAPVCQVGDIIQAWIAGAASSAVQSLNIVSPSSGHSYNCGSLRTNGTNTVSCTVPAVSSSDLNEVLGVSITVGGSTSTAFTSGLYIPLA